MKVEKDGHLVARDGRHVFLVKHRGAVGQVSLPQEYIGKRVKLFLEVV
jgi:putative transposon-encoded protein